MAVNAHRSVGLVVTLLAVLKAGGFYVPIDPDQPGNIFDCPASYAPSVGRGVLSRLVFHFGLGQAF